MSRMGNHVGHVSKVTAQHSEKKASGAGRGCWYQSTSAHSAAIASVSATTIEKKYQAVTDATK
jgi:hypothetical protein